MPEWHNGTALVSNGLLSLDQPNRRFVGTSISVEVKKVSQEIKELQL